MSRVQFDCQARSLDGFLALEGLSDRFQQFMHDHRHCRIAITRSYSVLQCWRARPVVDYGELISFVPVGEMSEDDYSDGTGNTWTMECGSCRRETVLRGPELGAGQ
jgi:hypothetical protein